MIIRAKDVMSDNYGTVQFDTPIIAAIRKTFQGKLRKTGHKTVSLLVLDEIGRLVGSLSMYDVLYHFRPSFVQYDVDSIDEWVGQLDPLMEEFQDQTVEQVMNRNVEVVQPNDHLMVVIDHMIKGNIRRIAVVEDMKVVGVIFLPDIYFYLFQKFV